MKPRVSSTDLMADRYAELMAKKADLEKEVSALKECMLATGRKEFDGLYARVTVSATEPGLVFDGKLAEKFLRQHGFPVPMKSRAGSVRFNCNARSAKAVAKSA